MLRHAGWGTWLSILSLRSCLCFLLWKNWEDGWVKAGGKNLLWQNRKTKSCFYEANPTCPIMRKFLLCEFQHARNHQEDIKTLLHSDSVLTCCKTMGGCHQVNKNCSKVMSHHYNWFMNLHLVFVYSFAFVVRVKELWQKSCLSLEGFM